MAGDLTKIGSTVKLRGAQYTDSYRSNATGDTGFLTGLSGRMVAYGWLLGKDLNNKTISLGDGNRVVRAFDEEYNVGGRRQGLHGQHTISAALIGGRLCLHCHDFRRYARFPPWTATATSTTRPPMRDNRPW
jgi:hypothetical protein